MINKQKMRDGFNRVAEFVDAHGLELQLGMGAWVIGVLLFTGVRQHYRNLENEARELPSIEAPAFLDPEKIKVEIDTTQSSAPTDKIPPAVPALK